MRKFFRAAALLVFTLAALMCAGVASAAGGYSLFGTGSIALPGNASARAAQATADGAGGVVFDVPAGLTVGTLTTLATDYQFTVGSCGLGSPRFQVQVQTTTGAENLFVYLGPAPSYTDCPSNAWTPSGNLADPANLVDASQLGGSWYEPFGLVQATFGTFPVTGIALVTDGGQTVQFDNTQIDDTTVTYDCTPTGFSRDGMELTAAQVGGNVTGALDARGCNIGAYNPDSVDGAEISGANYFGVVVNGASADVKNSSIHDIGEVPFNGTQHGVGIYYTEASGEISGNDVSRYQKGGIVVTNDSAATVTDNVVTGLGPLDYIAQNGIQISVGATALLTGNDVSGNDYTPPKVTSCGVLLYKAGGVSASRPGLSALRSENSIHDNETDLCNFGKGGAFDAS